MGFLIECTGFIDTKQSGIIPNLADTYSDQRRFIYRHDQ